MVEASSQSRIASDLNLSSSDLSAASTLGIDTEIKHSMGAYSCAIGISPRSAGRIKSVIPRLTTSFIGPIQAADGTPSVTQK